MQAISYRSFGAARDVLSLDPCECPPPGTGEVCVDLAFSGVNPSDVKARAGARAGMSRLPWPRIIPHSDGAGVISAVGPGVPSERIGQPVWIWNGQWRRPFGTAATRITLPAKQAIALPAGITPETGASLGIPGLTACHTVFGGGDIRGASILVQGGSGMVGYLAVQLARWGGAHVIATASPGARERVERAGAHVVLDYAAPDLADQILEANAGQPVSQIVDVEFGLNAETDAQVIAENGRISAYGAASHPVPQLPFYPLMFKSVTLEMPLIYLLTAEQRARAIQRLHAALCEEALIIPVDTVVPLADCARAHEIVESGARTGAVLLSCTQE